MTTPMMAQWQSCKTAAQDALLLFRLGDFYEAFHEDALILSKELDLTLTKRQDIPMAGVPAHSCETYLDRLVAKGYHVAIAEQIDDPKTTKGLVRRAVTRIVTPGTLVNSGLLSDKESNFLGCVFQLNQTYGLSLLDISTGELRVLEIDDRKNLLDELLRLRPKEILFPKKWKEGEKELLSEIKELFRPSLLFRGESHFDHSQALSFLLKHFKVHSLDGFGLKNNIAAINASGALLTYVHQDLNLPIDHIQTLSTQLPSNYLWLDLATQRNLELLVPLRSEQKEATLLYLLDDTMTPMGGRLLKDWLAHPLVSPAQIAKRQDAVEEFASHFSWLLQLRTHLNKIRDLERLIMRTQTGFASPRDLVALRFSLEEIPALLKILQSFSSALIREALQKLENPEAIASLISSQMVDEPPLRLSDGGVFKKGAHPDLDELLHLKSEGQNWIAHYQMNLRQTTGIKTLKVGYTQAFGYFIDVSRGALDKIPPHFHRRQTLVNNERYITDELKDFEYKILSADEKIAALESELFLQLRTAISVHSPLIRQMASALAQIDCLSTLAKVAKERGYTRPLVDESERFYIEEGRHPVIEAHLSYSFIPNNLDLGAGKQLALITGPNMAGKSTYIRQAALIAILAQIGSFVPAKAAHIGVLDKVFCRIGASDDLARGQSTFMVEMIETANILHSATERSLVILDEIGRGTSTYDGVSIAWAVAEYLLSIPGKRAKTLFATHYWELTELADKWEQAFNLTVAVHESPEEIIFLRKIIPGVADKSYGIHVARLAGLPNSVIKRAEEKLQTLEKEAKRPLPRPRKQQLDLFHEPL